MASIPNLSSSNPFVSLLYKKNKAKWLLIPAFNAANPIIFFLWYRLLSSRRSQPLNVNCYWNLAISTHVFSATPFYNQFKTNTYLFSDLPAILNYNSSVELHIKKNPIIILFYIMLNSFFYLSAHCKSSSIFHKIIPFMFYSLTKFSGEVSDTFLSSICTLVSLKHKYNSIHAKTVKLAAPTDLETDNNLTPYLIKIDTFLEHISLSTLLNLFKLLFFYENLPNKSSQIWPNRIKHSFINSYLFSVDYRMNKTNIEIDELEKSVSFQFFQFLLTTLAVLILFFANRSPLWLFDNIRYIHLSKKTQYILICWIFENAVWRTNKSEQSSIIIAPYLNIFVNFITSVSITAQPLPMRSTSSSYPTYNTWSILASSAWSKKYFSQALNINNLGFFSFKLVKFFSFTPRTLPFSTNLSYILQPNLTHYKNKSTHSIVFSKPLSFSASKKFALLSSYFETPYLNCFFFFHKSFSIQVLKKLLKSQTQLFIWDHFSYTVISSSYRKLLSKQTQSALFLYFKIYKFLFFFKLFLPFSKIKLHLSFFFGFFLFYKPLLYSNLPLLQNNINSLSNFLYPDQAPSNHIIGFKQSI